MASPDGTGEGTAWCEHALSVDSPPQPTRTAASPPLPLTLSGTRVHFKVDHML